MVFVLCVVLFLEYQIVNGATGEEMVVCPASQMCPVWGVNSTYASLCMIISGPVVTLTVGPADSHL